MTFAIIYDIQQAGCRTWFLAPAGLVLLLLSAVMPWNAHSFTAWRRPAMSRPFALVFFGLFTVLAFVSTWGEYWLLVRDLKDGRDRTLAGIVEEFTPAPTYKGTERFTVRGHEFSYKRFETSQGFHKMSADGSPLANCVCVQVVYVDNHILRLAVGVPTGGKHESRGALGGETCTAAN